MTDVKIRENFEIRGISFEDTDMFYQMLAMAKRNSHDGGVDIFSFVMMCMRLKGGATSIDLHTLAFEVKLMHQAQRNLSGFCQEQFSRLGELFDKAFKGNGGQIFDASMEARLQCLEQDVAWACGNHEEKVAVVHLSPTTESTPGMRTVLAAIDESTSRATGPPLRQGGFL